MGEMVMELKRNWRKAETAQDAPPKQMMRLLREFGEVSCAIRGLSAMKKRQVFAVCAPPVVPVCAPKPATAAIETLIPPGPRFVQNFAAKPPDGMDVILGGTER
jgi:hypothetical protein